MSAIEVGEYVDVLVEGEPDPMVALVVANEGTHLFVTYLMETIDDYDGVPVFAWERQVNRVDYESIEHHYAGMTRPEDIGYVRIAPNAFCFIDDLGDESDDENDEDLDGFIVDDDEIDDMPTNADFPRDERWEAWEPETAGARGFKDTVDRLEAEARRRLDDHHF